MSDRIVELEVRIAYQDRLIAELNDVVRSCADKLVALEGEVSELKRTITNAPPAVGEQDEPPPHY